MKISVRNVIFAIIIIICIIVLGVVIYGQFFGNAVPKEEIENQIDTSVENQILENNFTNLFQNTLDYQGYNVNTTGVTKIDFTKDLIYTLVERKQIVDNRYDLNLYIPKINISNNTSVEKFNERIKSLFINKADDIIKNATNNTIYTVEYMGYVNTNILSLVIKSTLKEGNNAQRVIVVTYNYNLSTNEEINLNSIIEIKGLQNKQVESTILSKVTAANQEAEDLKKLGYNVYTRDLTSDIYKLENTNTYIIGPNGKLYIIYPYGNANYTDEMDVIVF